MSDGNYTMTAKKLRFNYLNPSITLTGISFHPLKENLDQTYDVIADTLVLRIEKILPLLLNRQVNVEDILIVSPDIEIKRNDKAEKELRKDDLNRQVKQMQATTMSFLNELKVKRCTIKNASFRYFPIPGSQRKYSVQHINLAISDFNLPKPEDTKEFVVEGNIDLSIIDPEIEIPDSLRRVQLDYFTWSNKQHDVNVGKFSISQRALPPMSDSFLIQLDTIALRRINWKDWLDSGIVKLDTIMARNGNMYFESSAKEDRKNKKDSLDLKKLKVWDAIGNLEIDFFSAQYINVGIINRNPGEERNNSLIGDSLAIRGLSIRPDRDNPVQVNNLALSVRSFLDRGVNNKFQSSFSRLSLRGDTMLLNNYVLQSTKNSKFGLGNSLTIPSLAIKGISLQDLMDKKAYIREIRMDNPELIILTNSGSSNGKLELNSATFKEIRPYIDVDRVILNDGRISVRSRKNKDNIMGTEKFSAIILSKSALAAKDEDGILSSITDVNMDHLYFITPKTELEMFGGSINYREKTLHFNTVEGSLNNKKIIASFKDVTLQGSEDMKPFRKNETRHFKHVNVGSGTIEINLEDGPAGNKNDNDQLLASIDEMSLKNIDVKFRKGPMSGSAMVKAFNAEGQKAYNSGYKWEKFSGLVENLKVSNDKINLETDEADFSSFGRSSFRNARISANTGGTKFTTSTPLLVVKTEFHSFEPGNINLEYLGMERPVIRLDILKKDSSKDISADTSSRQFTLKEFNLTEPDIIIGMGNQEEKIVFNSQGKTLSGGGLSITDKAGLRIVELNQFNGKLDKVIVNSDSAEIFNANAVEFDLKSLERIGSAPMQMRMDNFTVGAVNLNRYHKGDTIELKTGGISFGSIPKFVLQKDSILNTAFKIPNAKIFPSDFFYRTPEKNIGIHQFSADTKAGYLMWDSLEITNRLTREEFWAKQPFEKDYLTVSTGRMRADDLRPVIYGSDTTVYVRKLTIDPLYIKVERDKRMPDDTVSYRPLLARTLKKIIPFPLKVDSINLLRSEVRHNVLKEKTGNEGSIFFTGIKGHIINLKTFDYQEHDSLRMALECLFMGQGNMVFAFRQDYIDTLQGFLLGARMGSLDMKELNRLITPMFLVRFDKGKLKSLEMRVKGNDKLAYGSMDMYYDGLTLSVLNEEGKKKNFYSFLVNLIVRTKNNKTGIVYAERLREKSIFNFWARISINGLLTNLGVRKNSAQERRFYRSLKKHQLPQNIF